MWSNVLNIQGLLLHLLHALINPFPHIDAFCRLCSRQIFENIVTKKEIAQKEQILLLQQCFTLLVIGYPFNYRDILFFDKVVCCRIVV